MASSNSTARRAERNHQQQGPVMASTSSSSTVPNSRNANSVRSRTLTNSSSRRSVTPTSRSVAGTTSGGGDDAGRVRVAVRLRPRNAEDRISDADFADCVELLPELKRLKLRKNNWSSETYQFDEVLSESATQNRVYQAVAKPVVESVLSGYNGTVMAYGQTGTGKTYTVGRSGKDDASQRGIMVRAVEDIIASTSPGFDSVEVSYLQLYLESIQDLLAPEKVNIPINEDRNGEVSVPGATVFKIRDLDHFMDLLQIGEANRHAANTKLNTESSRSHAILMIYVRRSVNQGVENETMSQEKDLRNDLSGANGIPRVRKSKLLIVDLAGSERVNKSGSEGHLLEEAKSINLSLTSLGKCINALAENSPHIPTRDSKLTRLLRDSFGGSARTSLIVTIGPSGRHLAETTSTIMFGQRAMKIVNMVKLKEEFDYESLCRKLETQVDHLTEEVEREQKLRESQKFELDKQLKGCQESFAESKNNLITRSELLEKENTRLQLEMMGIMNELDYNKSHNALLDKKLSQLEISLKQSQEKQLENSTFKKVLAERTQMYDKKMSVLMKQLEDEHARCESSEEQLNVMKNQLNDHQKLLEQCEIEKSRYQEALAETTRMYERKLAGLRKQLDDEQLRFRNAEEQLLSTKKTLSDSHLSIQQHEVQNSAYQEALADTTQMYERKIAELIKQVEDEHARVEGAQEQLDLANDLLAEQQNSTQESGGIDELRLKLQEMYELCADTQTELHSLKSDHEDLLLEKANIYEELQDTKQRLLVEEKQRRNIEHELDRLKKSAPDNDEFEDKISYMKENIGNGSPAAFGMYMGPPKSNTLRPTLSGQRATIAKICEEVGLQKILQLLASEDTEVQIHAVKVIANLAAEDINQEKIVEEGGLEALLMLLKSSQNTTILRVASGAIANLAMNELNQGLIMGKGGAQLLSMTSTKTDDPQTLRMVAGALANLCGNERVHLMLKEDGGIKALLGMARSGNSDVVAQVARGMANFAKCESRGIIQGQRRGYSLLLEEGVLEWLIANSTSTAASIRRHVELALCHLAQNEDNARDFISGGGVRELVRISVESNREDIRNLAKRTLKMNPAFQAN